MAGVTRRNFVVVVTSTTRPLEAAGEPTARSLRSWPVRCLASLLRVARNLIYLAYKRCKGWAQVYPEIPVFPVHAIHSILYICALILSLASPAPLKAVLHALKLVHNLAVFGELIKLERSDVEIKTTHMTIK